MDCDPRCGDGVECSKPDCPVHSAFEKAKDAYHETLDGLIKAIDSVLEAQDPIVKESAIESAKHACQEAMRVFKRLEKEVKGEADGLQDQNIM